MSNVLAVLSKALLATSKQVDTLNIWESVDNTDNFTIEAKKSPAHETVNNTKNHQNIATDGFAMLFSKDSKDD